MDIANLIMDITNHLYYDTMDYDLETGWIINYFMSNKIIYDVTKCFCLYNSNKYAHMT